MKKNLYYFTFMAIMFSLLVTSCQKDEMNDSDPGQQAPDVSEKNTNPDEYIIKDENARFRLEGYLYTQSNETGANKIHIFRQEADGSLTPQGTIATGGAGNGDDLGSQGSVVLSKSHHYLFAVNAGDNTISVFIVGNTGGLTLVDLIGSGGTTPVSICHRGPFVYVVNSGSDNIAGFTIDSHGDLSPLPGSIQSLSGTNVQPAQIGFSPTGKYLYVTEKNSNTIAAFKVNVDGVAAPGNFIPSMGDTPFGFKCARRSVLFVTNAENGSAGAGSCTAYGGVMNGSLLSTNGAVGNSQAATCWVALSQYERYAFVTNTGSDNISTYYISPWGSIYLIHSVAANTDDNPIDICVSGNNFYVYNLNSVSNTITGFTRGFLGTLFTNTTVNGLPDHASGLAAW